MNRPITARRTTALVASTVLFLGVLVAPDAGAASKPSGRASGSRAGHVAQAVRSYDALQRYFAADDGSGLYREQYPVESTDNDYSYEWPFSQAHVATLDLAAMPGRGGRIFAPDLAAHDKAQVAGYWSHDGTTGRPGFASGAVAPYGSGGDFFYDDNEWVGLEDAQHVLQHHDMASLRQAEKIFRLVRSGWDTDDSHAAPGGVFWTQASWSTDRNTVSNMPGAELGLRLYQLTGQPSYLRWAQRMYDWTNKYLQAPNGLYHDHLDLQGTVDKTIWSCNQGVPVGVNVLFYKVTGDRAYLHEAKRIASAASDYFATAGRLDAQPPYFNSIFFKNLLLLESVTGGHRYRAAMATYAERMWRTNRDPATGLFHFAQAGDDHVQMIEQAAMTQIYAVLAWRRSEDRDLY